jgi:hypothetical protein
LKSQQARDVVHNQSACLLPLARPFILPTARSTTRHGTRKGALEQETAGRIARVVVAGNLIAPVEEDDGELETWATKTEADSVSSMHQLDEVVAHL